MLKIRGKYLEIVLVFAAVSLLSACGKKSSKKTVIEPPQRSGTSYVSYSSKYSDYHPALSADGSRVVFISGRESDDSNSVLKAYKFNWMAGQAPDLDSVVRVTSSDLGRETQAVISPDGKWIALSATSAGGNTAIYIQDYDQASPVRLITETLSSLDQLSFSPNSRMLMWLKKSQSEVRVEVADIGTAATDAVSAIASPDAVTYAANVAWLTGTGDGYSVAVSEAGPEGATAIVLNRYSFVVLADLEVASAEKMLESPLYNKSVNMVSASGQIAFVTKVAASSRILVPRFGKVEDPQPSIPLRNQPSWITAGAEAASQNTEAPFAYDTSDLTIGADATSLFALNKTYYYCEGDTASTFGSDIVNINLTDKSVVRLVPRLNATGDGFEVANGLCDNAGADTIRRRMDDRITEVSVNKAATAGQFRLAYVSRMSTKFDASCVLKLGDPDIYLVDVTAEGKTIYPLSGNQVPLDSDPRPEGAEACNL